MPTEAQLEADVRSSIALDPRIPDPAEIAVSNQGGIVKLRGTVESFVQRSAAVLDAEATEGVYAVEDELDVNLLEEHRREDDEIRGIALQVLTWDIEVPAESIDVQVEDGWVTLKGLAEFQFRTRRGLQRRRKPVRRCRHHRRDRYLHAVTWARVGWNSPRERRGGPNCTRVRIHESERAMRRAEATAPLAIRRTRIPMRIPSAIEMIDTSVATKLVTPAVGSSPTSLSEADQTECTGDEQPERR